MARQDSEPVVLTGGHATRPHVKSENTSMSALHRPLLLNCGFNRYADTRPAPATEACGLARRVPPPNAAWSATRATDRKSTRLNSSHRTISYAVFCLKKKKKQ